VHGLVPWTCSRFSRTTENAFPSGRHARTLHTQFDPVKKWARGVLSLENDRRPRVNDSVRNTSGLICPLTRVSLLSTHTHTHTSYTCNNETSDKRNVCVRIRLSQVILLYISRDSSVVRFNYLMAEGSPRVYIYGSRIKLIRSVRICARVCLYRKRDVYIYLWERERQFHRDQPQTCLYGSIKTRRRICRLVVVIYARTHLVIRTATSI